MPKENRIEGKKYICPETGLTKTKTIRYRYKPVKKHGSNDLSNTKEKGFDVGYGKPPKEHQFQPGQSGNPKGRPKQKKKIIKSIEDYIYDIGGEKVTIQTPEGKKTVTRNHAIAHKFFDDMSKVRGIGFYREAFNIQSKITEKRMKENPDDNIGFLQKGLLGVIVGGTKWGRQHFYDIFGEYPDEFGDDYDPENLDGNEDDPEDQKSDGSNENPPEE